MSMFWARGPTNLNPPRVFRSVCLFYVVITSLAMYATQRWVSNVEEWPHKARKLLEDAFVAT